MYLNGYSGVYMASTTMVHVRVDEKTKARATKALASMGLSVSDAVRVMLTRVAVEKRLPFALRVPNAATQTAMREARALSKPRFSDADEMLHELEKDAE
jgi:DNA-damage-inducible protein J